MPNPTYVPLLGTAGNVSFGGNLAVAGNETVGGTLAVTGNTTLSGTLTVNGQLITPVKNGADPAMSGVSAWNYDPETAGSGGLLVSGTLYLHKVIIDTAITANNIVIGVTVAGGTLTSGQNLCGIYDSNGNLLATSVDQTTAWGTNGGKACALTAPVALPAGTYYVAILSVGTTPITLAESPGFAVAYNNVQTAAMLRHSTNGTSLTALPATRTLSSNVSSTRSSWVGIS